MAFEKLKYKFDKLENICLNAILSGIWWTATDKEQEGKQETKGER